MIKCDKVFKNFLKADSTNFTWFVLEYFAPIIALELRISELMNFKKELE